MVVLGPENVWRLEILSWGKVILDPDEINGLHGTQTLLYTPQQGGSKGADTDILYSRYRGQASLEYKRRFRIQTTKGPRCILSRTAHFLSSISTACIPWRPFSGDWIVRWTAPPALPDEQSLFLTTYVCAPKTYRGILPSSIKASLGGMVVCCWKSFASASTPHGGMWFSVGSSRCPKKVTTSAEGGQMLQFAKTQMSDLYVAIRVAMMTPFDCSDFSFRKKSTNTVLSMNGDVQCTSIWNIIGQNPLEAKQWCMLYKNRNSKLPLSKKT